MLHSRRRIYRVNNLTRMSFFDMALTLLDFTFKLPTLYKVLSTLIGVLKFNSLDCLVLFNQNFLSNRRPSVGTSS
jgi:hypothetical protein